MKTMWDDPIVAEVHRIREQLAKESDFDVGTFFEMIRQRQALLGCNLVPPAKLDEESLGVELLTPPSSSSSASAT